jgi:diphthamide synthase (EF-2-diphthine--ammonia ligase)
MENPKFEKVLFWFIAIALFIALSCISHIALAQEIDVNSVVQKSFNTSADSVFGTLVGLLVAFNIALILGIGYLIRFIIRFLPQLNLTLQNNTKALEDLDTTIKNVVTNEVKGIITAALLHTEQNITRVLYEQQMRKP